MLKKKSPRPALRVAIQDGVDSEYTRNKTPRAILAVAQTLEIGEIRKADLQECEKLGEGSSGAVVKCIHIPTGIVMARKTVVLDPVSASAVIRELTLMHAISSPFIVRYYGSYTDSDDAQFLCICMEYCDLKSLDQIYRKVYKIGGFITEDLLGKICVAIVGALQYLHRKLRVIHRDIKPSNIVITRNGDIKLCDFGVSGLLVNSIANTFVGTSFYMSPERIQGHEYSIKSDVWSLGITLLELALGKFPYPFDVQKQQLPIFEILNYIIKEQVPCIPKNLIYSQTNPNGRLSSGFRDFIQNCLVKDPQKRPSPETIMQHGFFQHWNSTFVDKAAWARIISSWTDMHAS